MAKRLAPRPPLLRILMHPFYGERRRGDEKGYSRARARLLDLSWRQQIQEARASGEHFVFVSNLLERKDFEQVKNAVDEDRSLFGEDMEKQLLGRAYRLLGDKLVFVPKEDREGVYSLNWFRKKHLKPLEKKLGVPASKLRVRIFGELADDYCVPQKKMLCSEGVPAENIVIRTTLSVPKWRGVAPWQWQDVNGRARVLRSQGLSGKEFREKMREEFAELLKEAAVARKSRVETRSRQGSERIY